MAEPVRTRSRDSSPGAGRRRLAADPGRNASTASNSGAGRLLRTERLRWAEHRLGEVDDLPAPLASGRPLPAPLLSGLSRHLGRDLSRIRLHHDWFATELTEALDAQAVTHGDDIYLGADAADPDTSAGRAVLVHELFHSLGRGPMGGAGREHDEQAAERAGLAAGRDDLTSLPLTREPGQPLMRDGSDGRGEPGPFMEQARPPGGSAWLGLRAKATLTRHSDQDPDDAVSAGDALVRLVDRLFSQDPDDRGGRLTAVLGRLETSLRDAVVTAVAARNGGHAQSTLPELARASGPQDGGYAEPATDTATHEPDAGTAPDSPAGEEAEPEVAADAESGPSGQVGAAEPDAAVVPEGGGATTPGPAAKDDAGADADAGADEQPPAVAALDLPAGQQAPQAAAAPAAGPGIVPGGSAPSPTVSSGGEAPAATAAEVPAGPETGPGPAPGAEPGPARPAPEAAPGPRSEAETETGPESEAAPEPEAAPEAEAAPEPAPEPASEPEAAPEAEAAPEPAPEPETASEPADTAVSAETAGPEAPTAPGGQPAGEPGPPEAAASEAATAPETETPETETAHGETAPAGSTEAEDLPPGSGAAEPQTEPSVAETSGAGAADGAMPPPAADTEPVLADPSVPSSGGGEGGAIADPPEPAVPDVSAMEPQAALGAVASLPVTRLASSLGGVSAAAQRTVGDAQADLAANPPSMERPSGVPADKDASLPPAPLPPLPAAAGRTVPPLAGGPGAQPPAPVAPPPAPAPVTLSVPDAKAGGDTQISAEDAARIQGAVKELPVTDPALDVDAGPVPELELSGGEDPKQVTDQAARVEDATSAAQQDGLADARADMGENDVLPQVPKETLTGDVSGGGGAQAGSSAAPAPAGPSPAASAPAGPAATGLASSGGLGAGAAGAAAGAGSAVPTAAIDAVAAEQGADQVNTSTQTQRAALGTARDEQKNSAEQARSDTDKQINEEIASNGGEQTKQRRDVRAEVGANRKAWVGEQDKIAAGSREAAGSAAKTAGESVDTARNTARADAGKAIKGGNDTIARERSKAEKTAREQREKAERESEGGGFFSWLGSKVKSFFDGIKSAIHAAFDLARKAVDLAISTVQKLAVEAIELGRKAVMAAIEIGGKALAAASDIVLAGFPEARDRFRKKISDRVAAAKEAVNQLADDLKAGVKKLLDGLGKLLKDALSVLEKAYTAAIDAVAKVVDTVIKVAKAWVDALVDFAVLVADIAANPVQWLRNLGSGLLDGVRNHVWPSLVSAVKGWFKSKVEEVVGVGKLILDVLRKGGITFGKIVTMAWTAIKESLPGILIQLLIEKLVALLIPAGGALALIIDGIKAAWAAASRILAAFQKFIAFLKAVKAGNAGPKFGELVGAAAVAVMDFLANFVLSKLKGAGEKVGGTLRKMAERFMKAVRKVAGLVKTGAKAAAGAVKKGLMAAGRAIKKGAIALARTVKKVLPKNVVRLGAKAVGYVGTKIKAGVAKVKALYRKGKEKLFGKRKPKENREQKLTRAIDRTRTTVSGLLAKGVSRLRLWATLKWLKARWGWKRLERKSTGTETFTIEGDINPSVTVGSGVSTLTILHSAGPVLVGSVPSTVPTPNLTPVRLGSPSVGKVSQQYPAALISQIRLPGQPLMPGRIEQIGQADIGRPVDVILPGRTFLAQGPGGLPVDVREHRIAGGESTLSRARLNVEMAMRKGGDVEPFVRPDVRTTLVPGVDPTNGKRDPSRDSVHLYEITTMTSFVEGVRKMTLHKQEQITFTVSRLMAAYPDAKLHYTFIAPVQPDPATQALIQEIVTGLSAADQERFTVTWRAIGYRR